VLYVRTYKKRMYVRVLRTYGTTHNVPNEVIYGPYLTSTELYKISAILSSMRVASKRCRLSKLTRPSFGDSLSTLAGLTARKASDTGAVTARRSLQRPLLGAETQTTQRNQLVDQRVDQRPTQPTQWRTLLVSCPTQYYLEIDGSR
jgi:hypothetical protein